MNLKPNPFSLAIVALGILLCQNTKSQDVLKPKDLLNLKSVNDVQMSPDGNQIVYSVSSPRGPNESWGKAHVAYWNMGIEDGKPSPLINKTTKISSARWSPDGKSIGFIHSENGGVKQVWAIPSGGGEMIRLTESESDVSGFRWDPSGRGLAYLAKTPRTEKEIELEERGYGFIFYGENLKNTNLYFTEFDIGNGKIDPSKTSQLTDGVNVWDFEFNRQGTLIAAAISAKNLIDHSYMFKRIHLVDLSTGEITKISENEGKLGNYAFSPDGKHLAYTAALNLNDHAVSQVFITTIENPQILNLTPPDLRGHISWVGWKDNDELVYFSEEGVYPKLNLVSLGGDKRKIILDSEVSGIVFDEPVFTADFKMFVFTGSTPANPGNIYLWDGKSDPEKITDINPVLDQKTLGRQEVISYDARDGLVIEGLLIYPVGYEKGKKYPLIVYVHGGPESHYSNEWLSSYSRPGQVLAGKGYLVFYPNYRSSTGYGVDFGMEGFGDPAGKEFDDIADGIDYMIREKGADPERVGLAGGSYGGYASAWFATYYTKYVKAVCMFVGISDLISKRSTTDIPYEILYVHMDKRLEGNWQFNLERSPVYWAHQSKTATLIYGGAADTRVHPSQSLELYRRMKMNDHPAVRLVQYPEEGHGNSRQTGRIDVLCRQIEWFDWYVRDLNPLDGPMPPLDISDKYGLDWDH